MVEFIGCLGMLLLVLLVIFCVVDRICDCIIEFAKIKYPPFQVIDKINDEVIFYREEN